MAYVFYDTETSGLSSEFDQILQFAAIRTDNDFNETDRFEIRSRLLPYIVPSPGALRVTGIGPDLLMDATLSSHYQATCQIREKLLEWSPAIFLGYNTIKFDEDFLRQALFQTLHSPYITNTQGNVRADVLRLVHAAVAYAPDCLAIPINDKGSLSSSSISWLRRTASAMRMLTKPWPTLKPRSTSPRSSERERLRFGKMS